MNKSKNRLIVLFDEKSSEPLYQGDSWYRKNLVDQLDIRRDRIEISFVRAGKIDSDYLFTSSCPVRIQLYRAACFYLAVTGRMPDVKEIALFQGDKRIEIDGERLTRHWANCRTEITIPPEVAVRCFRENGLKCHIAITFFLKAQLDTFPHDCFRAAWSGINALYNGLKKDKNDKDNLNALSDFLRRQKPRRAEKYLRSLDNSFWDHLEWYNYIKWNSLEKATEEVFETECFHDRLLYDKIAKQILIQRGKSGKDQAETERLHAVYLKKLEKRSNIINERVRFLVTSYCYMLRNRSFHAGRPYPVFGLFEENMEYPEQILTKVLLYTICDLLENSIDCLCL